MLSNSALKTIIADRQHFFKKITNKYRKAVENKH
jgi:hypothetical protein